MARDGVCMCQLAARMSEAGTEARACGVLTVSDRCYRGEAEDKSGPSLKKVIQEFSSLGVPGGAIELKCVPDEVEAIQAALREWSDVKRLSLVLTTGGTGFSPRDVTPEATRPLLEREAPGIVVAMISKSLAITPMAMLSRPACGTRGRTLIVNLPGSTKGSRECLEFILPALPHALDLLQGRVAAVESTHTAVQQSTDRATSHHEHICPHGRVKSEKEGRSRSDFHKVALRPRHSPYPMLSVDEALQIVMASAPCLGHTSVDGLQSALGHVLAEAIIAKSPVPPFPASVKDGYAVLSADGPGVREVVGPVSAGERPSIRVTPGCVARVTTGAPIPEGADAVVQVEDTVLVESSADGMEEKRVEILTAVACGNDIRSVGSDVCAGEVVLREGERLGPAELGLVATVGVTRLNVYRRPRVAVLSTGNEVIEPGQVLLAGQIYDSNKTTLMAALREQGFECHDAGLAEDDPATLKTRLLERLREADVLISSGGVSMGEKDYLKPTLEEIGATVHFGRVLMKPGKPTTFATLEMDGKKKLIFALPGNPVSCLVTLHLFALPALRKMAGHKQHLTTVVTAELSSDVTLDPRPEYHRAVLQWVPHRDCPVAVSTGSQCSSRLLSVRSANALMVLPPRTQHLTQLQRGSKVQAMLLTSLI